MRRRMAEKRGIKMLKNLRLLCSFMLMIIMLLCGCGNEEQQDMTKFKTSNSHNTTEFEINGDTLKILGETDDLKQKYILIVLDKDTENANKTEVVSGKYETEIQLPDKKETLIELYSGQTEYGTFQGIITDYIKAEKVDDTRAFIKSPVYESNKNIYSKEKNASEYLAETGAIQSKDTEISVLAQELTKDITDEYDRVKAVHDWVAENIYYDYDALYGGSYQDMDARSVLMTRKGVCEGYANLTAALLRSIGIPCKLQGGYALGIDTKKEWTLSNIDTTEENHAWNEAYVNGRWIIIDVTWDSQNQYKDGRYIMGDTVTQTYFDSTIEFFSLSHKFIDKDEDL